MPNFRFFDQFVFALFLIGFTATPCFGLQSGSRGAAPSLGNSGTNSSFATPSPSFQSPQAFSVPQTFAAPSQSFSSPTQAQIQPTPVVQGVPTSGFQNFQYSTPSNAIPMQNGIQMTPSAQPPASASSSRGVPDSGLVDPIFQVNNPGSPYVVDHSTWDCFLSRYLTTDSQGINRIRYGQITRQDRQQLQGYLDQLQSTDIRALNRNEQLAYWFNLYNARTVALVVDRYPIRSIRQIKQKLTDFVGPFDDQGAVNVLGKSLSLNDIESGIIRPVWNDPRIHYALNCASYGCPNIAPTAWTAHDLEGRLNGAAYQYINSNRAVKRSPFGPRLSKIYKWYKADFGGNDQAVLSHIRQYANQNTLNKINGSSTIAGHFYDWSLNDAKNSRPRLFESIRR